MVKVLWMGFVFVLSFHLVFFMMSWVEGLLLYPRVL